MSPETASCCEITTATTLPELERLAPEWRALWQRDPSATPFQSPAWLIPWARHFTSGDLCCVVAREAGRLAGLLPAFVWRNRGTRQRELLLLGTGISDYGGGVFDPMLAHELAHAMLSHLHSLDCWDVLRFEELRPDSPLASAADRLEPQSVCPVLRLPRALKDAATIVPRGQWQEVAYCRRRASRLGTCRWETADAGSVDEFMNALFALHAARWAERGERGIFHEPAVRLFHREAARALLALGALRLHRLAIGSTTVGVLQAFASHGRAYYYSSGFDPAFARISPGTLMIGAAIEQAAQEGCRELDFLRGAEAYKYLWGARDTQTFRWRAWRRHPAGICSP